MYLATPNYIAMAFHVFGRIDESRETFSRLVDDIDREGERRDLRPEEIEVRSSATKRIWDL